MSSYPFNNSFTKQFRQEQPASFSAEEKPFQQIVISTYSTITDADVNKLGAHLTQQLHDNAIIHRLLAKLTQKDSPDIARLTAYVQEVHQLLRANANAEPFTAQYYKHLIELVASFLDLVTEFDMNGQELLLGNLNACYSNEDSFAVNQSVD